MARTVEDAALLLQAIAGHDRRDSTSYKAEIPDYRTALAEKEGPWTIGVPKECFAEGLDPEIKAAVEAAIAFYEKDGHTVQEVSLPMTEYAIPTYYILATAEASSNLARYDGIRYTHRSKDAKLTPSTCTTRAAPRASARRSSAALFSAPTCSPAATTTPTTCAPRRSAPSSAKSSCSVFKSVGHDPHADHSHPVL